MVANLSTASPEQRTDLVKVGQFFERAFLFKTGVAAGAEPGGFGDFSRLDAEPLAGLADDVADVIFNAIRAEAGSAGIYKLRLAALWSFKTLRGLHPAASSRFQ